MLWRKAVLIKRGNRCWICDKFDIPDNLECHHFIKRRKKILAYSWINGFPVHHFECHQIAHTKKGERKLTETMSQLNYEYLLEMEPYTLKQYLFEHCISRAEWEQGIVKELKSIIQEAD